VKENTASRATDEVLPHDVAPSPTIMDRSAEPIPVVPPIGGLMSVGIEQLSPGTITGAVIAAWSVQVAGVADEDSIMT
jgi:hypothetical protein